jgi:two-component system, chemotaxis family, sensor kinase Cph1
MATTVETPEETPETLDNIDLTNCDREPIHIPGLVQPHGVLLVLKEPNLEIVQVSSNTQVMTGRSPESLLGKPLSDLLAAEQIEAIQACLQENFESINPLDLLIALNLDAPNPDGLNLDDQNPDDLNPAATPLKVVHFDGIVHRLEEAIVLELEPKANRKKTDFFTFYKQVKGTITRIQKALTLSDMSQVLVNEVRRITGFERVMVYRFDDDGVGSIIAEDTDHATPYLHLRYPASDIPKQARALYTLNWLRLIPDASYEPIPLIPPDNPITQQPLDLSFSALRSVSPIHLEYLCNMGVTASMSISLMQGQKLWGLIACHHYSPKYVPYDIRTACEFIGQVASVELANKEVSEDTDYRMQLKSIQTQFVDALSQASYFLDGITQLDTKLLDLVNATGAVVCSNGQCIRLGEVPSEEEIHALLNWIKPQMEQNLFETRSLSLQYPAAESFQAIASGVMALEISRVHHNYILWFRPEVAQTLTWGGNPNKPLEVTTDGSLRMSPRKSFEAWQETVQGMALPWKACEIESVIELRSLLVGIVLRQADELASMNFELQRSNEELDSFAYIASHDLKEPLRGIHNYANFLMEDYEAALDEGGVAKLQTLVRLTQRMEDLINSLLHFSQLGRANTIRQPVNLNELAAQVIETLTITRPQNEVEFRIPRSLPIVACDLAQVNELLTNLISNAIKYNNKAEKWVEIGYLEPENSWDSAQHARNPLTFYVRDNGIGIGPEHVEKIFQIFRRLHGRDEFGGGTGAGLTIARKIVERHEGRIWLESTPGEGSTFYFTLAAMEATE